MSKLPIEVLQNLSTKTLEVFGMKRHLILEVLKKKKQANIDEVLIELYNQYKMVVARNTVYTVLNRAVRKGMVETVQGRNNKEKLYRIVK